MEARELRFDNWVMDKHIDGEPRLVQVGIMQLEYPHDCEPIPLTEDWLIHFGFEFDENKGFEYIGDDGMRGIIEDRPCWFINHSDKMRFCVYLDDMTCYISLKCDHVHQLQNAFYCVTGEELTDKKKLNEKGN